MMKKLLMWSALLMTGFAFYSCDDVVDNPAQDPAQSWNYSVSVKFADFTGVAYQAPTTLYVFDENLKPMGTITTETAPAAGTAATYAGTITGAIGDNLIISTTDGKEFTKQDGTLASATQYGIIQTAKVPIKIYNANTQNITTGAAKMENLTGIVEFKYAGSAADDDKKITFSTDDLNIPGLEEKSFSITLDDAVKPWTNSFYVALGKNTGDAIELQFTADGEERGFILKGKNESFNFDNGKVNAQQPLSMKIASTDLTKYWAAQKAADATLTEANIMIIDDGMTIMQSGEEAVPVIIKVQSAAAKKATLKGINAKRLWITGSSFNEITLEGTNKVDCETANYGLYIQNAKTTFTGTGSLDATGSSGIYVIGTYTDAESATQPAELVIDKGVTINATSEGGKGVYINTGTILTLNEEAKLNVTGKNYGIHIGGTKFNIGKGAIVNATATEDGSIGLSTASATVTIDNKAELTATGGKLGTGIHSYGNWDIKDAEKAEDGAKIVATSGKDGLGFEFRNGSSNTMAIGKYASIIAQGCPKVDENALGRGILTDANITLKEHAYVKAIGCDKYALNLGNPRSLTIAENAIVEAVDALGDAIQTNNNFTIKGKGKLIANEAGKNGINIESGTLTLDGAEVEAKGGAGKPAILATGTLTVTSNLVKLTATAGEGSTICISKSDAEAAKADIGTADTDKFNDAVKDGVRTIAPKAPAAE